MACGLVKLSPRWSQSKYDWFYAKKYDFFYRDPGVGAAALFETDLAGKGQTMRERLRDLPLPEKIRMLDIGAGTGFSFLTLPGSVKVDAFAVEASAKCVPFLKSKGVFIVGSDFSAAFGNEYQFIVARHVLEHVLDPAAFLRKIRDSLAHDGYLYVAVPNAMIFNEKKASSFFRHIHTYYFNLKTFLLLCKTAGLLPVRGEQDNEVWAILRKDERGNVGNPFLPEISPEEQLAVVKKYAGRSRQPLKRQAVTIARRLYYRAV
jgi:SAM-dependent methyltransferase